MKNYEIIHISATKGDKYIAKHCSVCLKKNMKIETRFL
jgi:hypothetical protein